jgi:hypothetical protein
MRMPIYRAILRGPPDRSCAAAGADQRRDSYTGPVVKVAVAFLPDGSALGGFSS